MTRFATATACLAVSAWTWRSTTGTQDFPEKSGNWNHLLEVVRLPTGRGAFVVARYGGRVARSIAGRGGISRTIFSSGCFASCSASFDGTSGVSLPQTAIIPPATLMQRLDGEYDRAGKRVDAPRIAVLIDEPLEIMRYQVTAADYEREAALRTRAIQGLGC